MKRKEQPFHVSRPWAAAQPFGRRQLDEAASVFTEGAIRLKRTV